MTRTESFDRQVVRLRGDSRERLAHIRNLLLDNGASAQGAIDEAIDLEAAAIRAAAARLTLRLVSDQSGKV